MTRRRVRILTDRDVDILEGVIAKSKSSPTERDDPWNQGGLEPTANSYLLKGPSPSGLPARVIGQTRLGKAKCQLVGFTPDDEEALEEGDYSLTDLMMPHDNTVKAELMVYNPWLLPVLPDQYFEARLNKMGLWIAERIAEHIGKPNANAAKGEVATITLWLDRDTATTVTVSAIALGHGVTAGKWVIVAQVGEDDVVGAYE